LCCEEVIAAEDNLSLTGHFAAQGCSLYVVPSLMREVILVRL